LADVNSNININFDTAAALAQLRSLQAGLSRFHQSLAEGNLAAANAQKGLNAQLLQSVGATGKFSASQVKVAGSTLAFTSALEKNKLSLREYYRYTMAAATANTRVLGKAFAAEREIINRARRDRVKALQAQYIQMNKSNAGFMDAIKIMPKSLAMANGKFTELGTRIQYAAQRQQFLNQLLKQGSTQLLNFGKNTQWAGRQLMVGLTMPLALFGSMAAKTFRELETEIVKFKRVYGDAFTNDAETDAAVNNIRRLASEYTKYGVSVTKTVEMAATAAAAGFTGAGLTGQVETATKLAVLGQIEQQQALETTISLQNAFGISSEELAKKIDFLNAVENQTVLSIEDLTIAIPKAAPVIKQLGGNVEDLAFFMTAMKEGGINASEGANALKSGLASLINPSKKASEFLANLGINISGIVEANKGDIKATVIGFSQALDTLDPLNRARAIEQLFGKFQFARLSTLFQNVTKDGTQASRALGLAGASIEELAILSEREMKKIEDSVGVKFQAAVEQFKQEIMPLGKIFLEALTPVVKFFGTLFEKFNGLSDQTKKVIAVIVGVVAGLGPVLLMTFGLLANGVANAIKFFALLRGGIARLNGQTNVLGAGFNYMTQEQIENAASSQSLHQTHTRLIEVFNVEKASVNALASSYNSLSTQMRAMASQNPALFAGGAPGARAATSKLPPVRRYKDGILTVPGPKGAGDIQPAMLAPGEAVIPAKTTEKYKGLISAIFNDKVPGFMAGRIPAGPAKYSTNDLIMQRIKRSTYPGTHPEKQSGPQFVGMPKSAEQASQSRQIVEKIAQQASLGRFGTLPPSDFGTLLQPFSGRSFPVRGVGGIYRKPNGEIVVVKPTMDERTALAEVRATEIAREVHGLIAPKQSIRTMIDPTDPSGQRKFIVVESPYDPRIAAMDGKFSRSDMIKQLVASTLRGDRDLQQPNLSGNVLADVGTAGVFDRASGFRDFAKTMPSMEEQAVVNLLGVKGGAKKFFAQETSSLAASMTPAQYDSAIKTEISKSIPKLEGLIRSWNADLDPAEKIVYQNMLQRLKAGQTTQWDKLQPIHARAGEGIKKLEFGNPEDFKNVPETKTQVDRLVAELNKDIENTLKELKKTNPEQYKRAMALLGKSGVVPKADGSINFKESKIYSDFIAKHLVYKDGVYHTTKAIEKGQSPTTSARSYDAIRDQLLYRMGAAPKPGRETFSNKPFTASRLLEDLTPTTQSGGWRANIDRNSDLYKALDKAEMEHKARNIANPKNVALNNLRTQMMADGYTARQVDAMLRTELSHLAKTGEAGLGPEKWKAGFAKFDLRLLNSYVNPGGKPGQPIKNPRLAKILDWDAKNGNALFNETQRAELKKALDFIKTGAHPVTESQARLVQAAAKAQVEADRYLTQYKEQNSGVKPKNFPDLGSVRQAKAVSMLLDSRLGSGYYRGTPTIYRLGPGPVLAQPGEYLADLESRTAERLSVGNTGSRPMGARPSTGKINDNLSVEETQTKRVMTATQARRGGFRMPGRDAGDPTLDSQSRRRGPSSDGLSQAAQRRINAGLIEKARLLRQDNRLTETQIQRAIERIKMQRTEAEITRARVHQERMALNEAKKNPPQTARQVRKAEQQQKRMARQQKIGGVSGGLAMGLGMAGSGMMMAGNQTAGMAMMGASAVAGLAPMFAGMGPFGLAITALAATGGGLFLLDRASKKAAESQSKLVDQTFATTEKMKGIGVLTGKVGASEIYDRKRQANASDRYTTGFERGKEQFGATFFENEVGKDVMSGFVKNMQSGTDTAAKTMAIQLAGYVSDGIMSAEQAHSVASQIGINLNNSTLTSQISGQLLDLIGPSGEDLLKNPLEIRMKLVQEQRSLSTNLTDRFEEDMAKESAGGNPINILFEGTRKKMAADVAAMNVQNLEFNRAQEDSLNAQYDKDLKILQTRRAATTDAAKQKEIDGEILALADKRKTGLADLRKTNEDIIKDQLRAFNIAKESPQVEGAFFDSLASQVRTKAEATGQGSFADTFLKTSAALDSKEIEVRINTIVASGSMPTATATSLLEMFGDDEAGLEKFLDVTTKMQDPGKVTQLINSLGGFKGQKSKAVVKTIIAKIANGDPEEADKLVSTIALMEKMAGKEINIEAFFEQEDAITKLEDLQKELEAVETMPTPITKEAITKLDTDGDGTVENMDALLAVWDQWGNLPDETKKTVIQEYFTVLRTITEGDIDAAILNEKAQVPGYIASSYIDQKYDTPEEREALARAIAAKRVMQQTKQDLESKKAGLGAEDGDGSGAKADPYQFLLEMLKNVRNAAINAKGGIEELNKALAAGNSKSVQNKFRGVEQQLIAQGRNRQFIDFVTSQDPADQAKYFKTAGSKIASGKNKGRIQDPYGKKGKLLPKTAQTGDVVLSGLGEKYNEAFDVYTIGKFNVGAKESLRLLNEQDVTRRKLVAAGYDAISIENILQDQYTTALIASDKITQKELAINVQLNKQLTNRQKINNMISRGTSAIQEQKDREKIPDVSKFLKSQGVSSDSLRSIIGDPGQLSEAIAAMEEYRKGGEGAATALQEIVAGLKAIQANSSIKVAIEFAQSTVANQIQKGAEAANRIMDAKRTVYSNLTLDRLSTATSSYRDPSKAAQQVGSIAKATVDKRYADTKTDIPTLGANDTIKSIQAARAANDKKISLSSSNLQSAQNARDAVQNQISDAENALQDAIDRANDGVDKAIKNVQKIISGYEDNIRSIEKTIRDKEDLIKKNFTDKIEAFNKESQKYGNDLEIMDKAAEDINEKYDKQVEALEKINQLNEQVLESQTQQLDLADALSQGDISAAAKIAQQMSASRAANQGSTMMQVLEGARTNELNSQTGAESGLTREQIADRQFEIGQEIYKLETSPEKIAIETQMLALREDILKVQELIAIKEKEIEGIEAGRAEVVALAQASAQATLDGLKASLKPLNDAVTLHQGILTTLEADEKKLSAQEGYLQAIANEAVDIDNTTGMTLKDWEETVNKVMSIEELAAAYAEATIAAELAVGAANTSWGEILAKINAIPSSVETTVKIKEIRTLIDAIGDKAGSGNAGGTKVDAATAALEASVTAAEATSASATTSLSKARRDFAEALNRGDWRNFDVLEAQIELKEKELKEANDKLAAAKKALADKLANPTVSAYDPNDPNHKGSYADGLAKYPYVASMGSYAATELKKLGYWADGGFIPKGTDTVPAMLTPGEYVLRKSAVDKYGTEHLDAMNLGYYKDGGEVKNKGLMSKLQNYFKQFGKNKESVDKAPGSRKYTEGIIRGLYSLMPQIQALNPIT
jgi:TP901 family phage tail tape measure protein